MRAHEVEHAQAADAFHFQAEHHEVRHPGRAAREDSLGKQVLQSLAAIQEMHHAGSRRDLFECHQRGLRIQQVVVDDENIGAGDHAKARL
jgi:hypothetical protein